MSRNNYLIKKYGITSEQYEELLQKQEGCCGVCKRPASSFKSRLCVDHDHKTGHIRGALCSFCNLRIVGRHRTPSGEKLLRAAADYLTGPYPGWIVPVKKKKKRGRRIRLKRKKNG